MDTKRIIILNNGVQSMDQTKSAAEPARRATVDLKRDCVNER